MKIIALIGSAAFFMLVTSGAFAAGIHSYASEAGAHRHCPSDEVVYGESKSGGIYHFKGTRYYGNLANGRYVCKGEADDGGWRPAKNNQ